MGHPLVTLPLPITRFSIITDGEVWRFLECTRGDDDKPKFRLPREYRILYREAEEIMSKGVENIMEIITWCLAEAMKAGSTAGSGELGPRKRQKLGGQYNT